MNIYSLIPIVAFFFNGFVCTFIFAQKKDSPINRAFLFYGGVLAYWIFIVFLLRIPIPSDLIFPLMKSASISWLSITFLYLNFVYVFLDKKKDLIYFVFLGIVVLSIFISLTTNQVLSGFEYVNWGVNKKIGSLFLPAIFFSVSLPAFYSLYLIFMAMRVAKDFNMKHSLPLLFTGSLLTLLIGITSNIIIPLFFGLKHFVEFAESSTVIQSIFIFRAVVKYKLFGIGVDELGQELFANMMDAVVILDKEGRVLQVNAYAEKLFGLSLANKSQVVNINNIFNNYEINQDFTDHETSYISNGEKKILSLSQMAIIHKDIELGRILIARDITERKRSEEALRESEEKYRWLFENVPDGIYLSIPDGKLVDANETLVRMLGYNSKEELLAADIANELYLNPSERTFWIQKLEVNGKLHNIELYLKRKDGSPLIVRERAHLLADKRGILYYEGTLTDITGLKEAEKAQRSSEIRFHSVWENSVEGMRLTDKNGNIIAVNEAFCKMIEMKAQDIVEQPLTVTYRENKNKESMLRNYRARFKERSIQAHLEQKLILPSGKSVYLDGSHTFVDIENGNALLLSVFRDVTEFKTVENKLRISREELRALSANLQSAREEERTHIAREIHDELGQVLTAVKMDISLLSDSISDSKNAESRNIVLELKSIDRLIDDLINKVRNIATELRPDVLDHLGLVSAIDWQINEFMKRNKIKCTFHYTVKHVDLSNEQTTAIFRILQEALTNIVRHSSATEVNVDLIKGENYLILQVKDNGIGISQEQLNNIKSIGVIGMRERTLILGGEIAIEGNSEDGTTVILKVPLKN